MQPDVLDKKVEPKVSEVDVVAEMQTLTTDSHQEAPTERTHATTIEPRPVTAAAEQLDAIVVNHLLETPEQTEATAPAITNTVSEALPIVTSTLEGRLAGEDIVHAVLTEAATDELEPVAAPTEYETQPQPPTADDESLLAAILKLDEQTLSEGRIAELTELYEPEASEDFADTVADILLAPVPSTETDGQIDPGAEPLSPDIESSDLPSLTELAASLPPEVQELNAAIAEQLEQLPDDEQRAIRQTIQHILESVESFEDFVRSVHQPKGETAGLDESLEQLPEVGSDAYREALQEFEVTILESCRELADKLGLPADDDTLRAFARHIVLLHSHERRHLDSDPQRTLNMLLLEEGTHEAKYFGIHTWRQLMRLMRRSLPSPQILGRYALAREGETRPQAA